MELEKGNAPIEEQIQQAALFAGTFNIHDLASEDDETHLKRVAENTAFHGRQEYVLRWLLKKLQNAEARGNPQVWWLLRALLGFVPVRNVAKVLNERKFIVVLRQTLQEAVQRQRAAPNLDKSSLHPDDNSGERFRGSPVKADGAKTGSKKRKRDGEVASNSTPEQWTETRRSNLPIAIYEAVNYLVQVSKPADLAAETFAAEYLKSTIRTTDEEAATILGSWLELWHASEFSSDENVRKWLLSPFIEIWDSRVIGSEGIAVFSNHVLPTCLALLSTQGHPPEWKSQLDKLIAANFMIPVRSTFGSSPSRNLMWPIANALVSKSSHFAPVFFDIAIRSTQPHGLRPRRSEDNAWLQAVFTILKDVIAGSSTDIESHATLAINRMLQNCIKHKLALELQMLQSITSQYGLKPRSTDWDIIATIIKVDANAFLIPLHSEVLLQDLFSRITQASIEATWPTVVDTVLDDVLIPLMGEFAKARQLIAFIHHWHGGLVTYEKLRQSQPKEVHYLSAWEDQALKLKLKDLMEASLTTQQILEVLDWLEEKASGSQGVVYVLLDAIAGALSREGTIAAVYANLYKTINIVPLSTSLDERYEAQRWRAITHVLDRSLCGRLNDSSELQVQYPQDLRKLLPGSQSSKSATPSLTTLEVFRCLCAAWSTGIITDGEIMSALKQHSESLNLLLQQVMSNLKSKSSSKLGKEVWGNRIITANRGPGWLACGYIHCILVEYPEVLE